MRSLVALTALALAAPSLAAEPPPTPSLNEARRLSPRDLAARLLGPAGGLYREARIYDGGTTGPAAMAITLAAAPRPTDFAGLCAASEIAIWFALDRDSAAAEADMATRVLGVSTSTVFRIVGDTNAPQPSGADLQQLASLCAAAGPVLGPLDGQNGPWGFFLMSEPDAVGAHLAGRALQQALADARAGIPAQLTCAEDRGEPDGNACADPRALLLALSPARITYVHLDDCFDDRAHNCVHLTFERRREHRPIQLIAVVIAVAAIDPDPQRPGLRLSGIAISHHRAPD